jgi:hypothetical protein
LGGAFTILYTTDVSILPFGGRLAHPLVCKRWKRIGGYKLVYNGIMLHYTDKQAAERFWHERKRMWEYRGSQKQIHDEKIQDLIKNGVLEQTTFEDLKWINPTNLVPKQNGGYRLVIDIRQVNRFMVHTHFKMEGAHTVLELLRKDDWAISFDLKDAYNHVPVHYSMRRLLGIAWHGRCYRFKGMAFGLSDAPRIFTQIMK